MNLPRSWRGLAAGVMFAASGFAATTASPTFSYSPVVMQQGGTLSFAGNSFNPAAAGVGISLSSASGRRTVLGAATLSAGSFTRRLTVPANLAPGLYFVNLVDSSGSAAINTTGTLTVLPPSMPWFTFSPTGLAPGHTVSVTASSLSQSSAYAAVALVSSSGGVTLLGQATLTNGGFSQHFAVPSLSAGSYTVVVRDSLGLNAFNVTGPMTLGTAPSNYPVGFYPVGVAVNVLANRVYVSNSGDNTVSVLDGNTSASLATIAVGQLPCAIAVNPVTNRIYVGNINSSDVTVINGSTFRVVQSIPVGKAPCAVALTPDTNQIFVGNYGDNTISVINGSTNTQTAMIPVSSTPAGLATNYVTNRLYSANGAAGTLSVIDTTSLETVAVVPVGQVPDAVGVNLSTNTVYVGNFMSRSVSVIDGNTNTVMATIPVGLGPSGVAVDSLRNRVFVGNYMSNSVSVIDGASNTVISTIPVGWIPDGIAVNSITGRVYSADSGSNSVAVIPQ